MKTADILAWLEAHYPLASQELWDASGLVLAPKGEVRGLGLSLTLTPEIICLSQAQGLDLLLVHHPLSFPLEPDALLSRKERILMGQLSDAGIGLYALHTPLDKSLMREALGSALGLVELAILDEESGMGGIGTLPEPLPLQEYYDIVKSALDLRTMQTARTAGNPLIRKVAFCGGSGKGLLEKAMEAGDVYLTGDLSYHSYENGVFFNFPIADIGHHASECQGMKALAVEMEQGLGIKTCYLDSEDFSRVLL